MANDKRAFNQVLEDLEVSYDDMMGEETGDAKPFIDRVIKKSKELANQLDSKSSLSESERTFRNKALLDEDAKAKAEAIYDSISTVISDQDPEVLVHLISMFPEITAMCQSSIRSMSMRSGNVTALSKRKINAMYIKLRDTYETYITFMKFMYPDRIYKNPPVIPPKKGNYSDYSASVGIREFEFIIDGETWLNPFPVAKRLGIEMKHYMDLPDAIKAIQKGDETVKINGHTVKLVDVSKTGDDDNDTD